MNEPRFIASVVEGFRRATTDFDLLDSAEAIWASALPSSRLLVRRDRPPAPRMPRLGGAPDLPAGMEWPRAGGRPLTFVAQVGSLAVFVDLAVAGAGLVLAEAGVAVVRVVPVPTARPVRRVEPPPLTPRLSGAEIDVVPAVSLPSEFSLVVAALDLGESAVDRYVALRDRVEGVEGLRDRPRHQLGGHPDQLLGDPHPTGAVEWSLFLQIASDDLLEVSWGDSGNLFVWVPTADLRAGRLDRMRATLQSW